MEYLPFIIKSFKHNGHLHRMWLNNWRIPDEMLEEIHKQENMIVIINDRTRVCEGNGHEWVSRLPAVTFFIPDQWFNVVALLEEEGVRFYCNISSPPYVMKDTVTYIDYDFDVIRYPDGEVRLVDVEEYEMHKMAYGYTEIVEKKVRDGLQEVHRRIENLESPFQKEIIFRYYEKWKKERGDME